MRMLKVLVEFSWAKNISCHRHTQSARPMLKMFTECLLELLVI